MVANDVVSVEFPSNATDGLEISTSTTEYAKQIIVLTEYPEIYHILEISLSEL
jgi:hypothetical protein